MSRTYRNSWMDDWYSVEAKYISREINTHRVCKWPRWSKYYCHTEEEVEKQASKYWNKAHRDGKSSWTTTSKNTYFKDLAKNYDRRKCRELEHKILSGNYQHDEIYPHRKGGKTYKWTVW